MGKGKLFLIIKFFLILILVAFLMLLFFNIIEPMVSDREQENFESNRVIASLDDFTSNEVGNERVLSIDENRDALLWRLRMFEKAENSIILTSFDFRSDECGQALMASMLNAANRGVKVKILLDGMCEPYIKHDKDFFIPFASHENVEVGFYNPFILKNLHKLNYRMHDKYIIIDDKMYMLGGRNTNNLFVGTFQDNIKSDREILVYETEKGQGKSYNELMNYFNKIWQEPSVKFVKSKGDKEDFQEQYANFDSIYQGLKVDFPDIATYDSWENDTLEANMVSFISNSEKSKQKAPMVLDVISGISKGSENIIIQTPYVISDDYMYGVLKDMSENSNVKILLNALEGGSNPWGSADYLRHKEDILETGVTLYEVLNDKAVHTKSVFIDDNISIVGSYNFDMRSSYLDTELMLVIDSKELNSELNQMNQVYMDKAIEVLPNGIETKGELYNSEGISNFKLNVYNVLKVIIQPFRHLL